MENLNDILAIDSNAKTKHFKKGEIIQSAGVISSLAFYVNKGLLRSYTIDDKGKEHIFMFAPENWLIGDGVLKDEPCQLFIDVLEDSVIIPIDKNDDILSNSIKLIKRVQVLQNRIIKLKKRPMGSLFFRKILYLVLKSL